MKTLTLSGIGGSNGIVTGVTLGPVDAFAGGVTVNPSRKRGWRNQHERSVRYGCSGIELSSHVTASGSIKRKAFRLLFLFLSILTNRQIR